MVCVRARAHVHAYLCLRAFSCGIAFLWLESSWVFFCGEEGLGAQVPSVGGLCVWVCLFVEGCLCVLVPFGGVFLSLFVCVFMCLCVSESFPAAELKPR